MKDKEMGSSSATEHTSPDGLTEAQHSAGELAAELWSRLGRIGSLVSLRAKTAQGVDFDVLMQVRELASEGCQLAGKWKRANPAESGANSPSDEGASAATSVADEPNTSSLLARVAELEGALREEREACANLAESHTLGEEIIRTGMSAEVNHVKLYAVVSRTIAKAIRARSALIGEE
jgi:hypothetical protein